MNDDVWFDNHKCASHLPSVEEVEKLTLRGSHAGIALIVDYENLNEKRKRCDV